MVKRVWILLLTAAPVLMALAVLLPAVSRLQAAAVGPGETAVLSQTTFLDVTVAAGVSVTHHMTPSYLATGQAWGDIDNDGWVDLYLTDQDGPNHLFHNNGDGTFSGPVFPGATALTSSVSGGAVFADYDNDGWNDLYVLNRGANVLLHNDGGTGFSDVTLAAGVGDADYGESGAWGDFDQDGYLDLYVVNWDATPAGSEDRLYQNNGDGTFTDISAALSLTQRIKPGFAVSFVDYDNDADLDIYVVNDKLSGNALWRNDGPGCTFWCFTDVSQPAGADTAVWGMGLAVGDYDRDRDLDFYFTNIGPMVLLQNQLDQGQATFTDTASAAGVAFDAVGWGTVFFDYDNDSWPDLYLATMDNDVNKTNRLFHNESGGVFSDASAASGASSIGPTLGVAYADYDRDGWLDLVIGDMGQQYRLYQNQAIDGSGNNWLTLRLAGGGPVNRNAIGSRVYLTTTDGLVQMQEVKSGSSLGAGNDMALHFGLGTESVAALKVRWPDGLTEILTGSLPLNQEWLLAYPQAGAWLSPGQTATSWANVTWTGVHTLTNQGNRPDLFSISIESAQGWVSPTVLSLALEALTTGQFTITAYIPNVTPPLTDTITVTVTSGNDPAVSATAVTTLRIVQRLIYMPVLLKP